MDGVLVSSSSISPRPQMRMMTAQSTAPADLGGHTVCARKNRFVCQRALELWVVACQHSLTQLIHPQWVVRLTECSAETNSTMGVFIRNVQKYGHEKSHLLRARDFYQQLNVYLTHAKSWVWSTVPKKNEIPFMYAFYSCICALWLNIIIEILLDVNGKLHTWLSASIYVRVPEWFTNTWDINKCFSSEFQQMKCFIRILWGCEYLHLQKKRSVWPPFSGWTQGLIIKQVTLCLSSACCCSRYSHVFNWQSCIGIFTGQWWYLLILYQPTGINKSLCVWTKPQRREDKSTQREGKQSSSEGPW